MNKCNDCIHKDICKYECTFIADTQEVVKIDSDEKKLDMGKFYDIQPGKKIFVRMRYDRIKDVVIHE